ncbi:MAG: YbgC/FadM family acyl-CoA thioesterase [Sphingomonadales bacterium]
MTEPSQGWIEDRVHRFPIRIYYQDTDVSGVVYHANYLNFLERGRTEYLRCLGISKNTLNRENPDAYAAFAIRDLSMEFLRPAVLDDSLLVHSVGKDVKGASCRIAQEIWRGTDLLVKAELRVVFLSVDLKPKRVPEDFKRHFRATIPGQTAEP